MVREYRHYRSFESFYIADSISYMDEDYYLSDNVYLSCEDVRQYHT